MTGPTLPDVVEEVNRLVDRAQKESLNLRLMGGLAVRLHSPHMQTAGLKRAYPDIDFVTQAGEQGRLEKFFTEMGYAPDKMFNTLNGARRQIFHDEQTGRHIDIFIGDFEMCHKLPLSERLGVQALTIPLAELFLSKTQIVQLNQKDGLDLIALLLDNPPGQADDGMINLERIATLCAKDWGLYTTTMLNLDRLEGLLSDETPSLDEAQKHTVHARIDAVRQAMQQAPKTPAWKLRDRVGTRVRWYNEVEEVQR